MQRRDVLLSGLAGAAALAGVPRQARAADALRITTIPLDSAAEPYFALEQGFFRDAGIDATVEPIASSAAIGPAVASGSVDVGYTNLLTAAIAYKHGAPFTLIAPGSSYVVQAPTSVLMVPTNSPVKIAKDLNGRIFGVNGLKTIGQYIPQYWIDKNGGDSTTVKYVEMTLPDLVQALASNRIDAAIISEPFVAEAKANNARVLANAFDAVGNAFIVGCWFSTVEWAKAHPALVAKFAQVMDRTASWAKTHETESGVILAKYGKIDPQLVRKMVRAVYTPRFDVAQMQPLIDLAARYGGLPATFPVSEMIYKPG
jgi:NitT/TauT family transport system substrate-binding protein